MEMGGKSGTSPVFSVILRHLAVVLVDVYYDRASSDSWIFLFERKWVFSFLLHDNLLSWTTCSIPTGPIGEEGGKDEGGVETLT